MAVEQGRDGDVLVADDDGVVVVRRRQNAADELGLDVDNCARPLRQRDSRTPTTARAVISRRAGERDGSRTQ